MSQNKKKYSALEVLEEIDRSKLESFDSEFLQNVSYQFDADNRSLNEISFDTSNGMDETIIDYIINLPGKHGAIPKT